MTPKYVSVCVKLLLKLTVFLMLVFPTSSTTQCSPKRTEKDGYVIRNVGIKMCELKCAENAECSSIEYNSDTLTCRLSTVESTEIKKKEGYVVRARDHSQVMTGACTFSKCSFGQRCLETRSGKAVCVEDEKQNYLEKSPQHKIIKQETFVGRSLPEACKKGDLNRAGHILSQGLVDINSRDMNHGKTPLMLVALEGPSRMFVFLIHNIWDVGNGCKITLHWACKSGPGRRFKCVLQQYDIYINAEETPPLLQPAFRGNRNLSKFLVCKGVEVLGQYRGKYVLGWAADHKHVRVMKYLLAQRIVDTNTGDKKGKTPLIMAVIYGYDGVFQLLMRMGANASQVDVYGENALHYACHLGRLGMVKYLVSKSSVEINGRSTGGRTPLMKASNMGHRDVFKILTDMGANVSQVDVNGNNILHSAALNGGMQMVKYLLSQNLVDINAKNKHGETAAMMARRHRHLNVYKLLVSRTQ